MRTPPRRVQTVSSLRLRFLGLTQSAEKRKKDLDVWRIVFIALDEMKRGRAPLRSIPPLPERVSVAMHRDTVASSLHARADGTSLAHATITYPTATHRER